jgi:membrane protein CcdC involved in cytochrome C biogenesis
MAELHLSVIAALLGFLTVLAWRIREGRRPVTLGAILVPPLGMSTGLSMFLIPSFHVPCSWAALSFALGAAVLAIPLMRTSRLTLEGSVVMVQRSSTFFLVIIALAAVRFFARQYIDAYLSLPQTAGLSFLLALGMITRWRTAMYLEYKRLVRSHIPIGLSPAQE